MSTAATPADTRPVRLRPRSKAETLAERNALVVANLNFARAQVHRGGDSGGEWDDELQEAFLGAIQAAEGFDPTQGTFTTRSAYRIRGRLADHRAYSRLPIHVPKHLRRRLVHYRRTARELEHELGRDATVDEVLDAMGLPEAQRPALRDAIDMEARLNADVPAVEPATDQPSPLDELVQSEEAGLLLGALNELGRISPVAAEAIRLRFGLDGDGERTLVQVAARIGRSRQRASQLVAGGMERLRELLEYRGGAA